MVQISLDIYLKRVTLNSFFLSIRAHRIEQVSANLPWTGVYDIITVQKRNTIIYFGQKEYNIQEKINRLIFPEPVKLGVNTARGH